MSYIGKKVRRVKRPIPTPDTTPIKIPVPEREGTEQPIEVPNWPAPVQVPVTNPQPSTGG